jgi:hypothetical protein
MTNPPQDETDLETLFEERLQRLPKPVRDAITSSDIEKNLRALSEKHKLHVDQWELLENEVKLGLFGFEPLENLEKNIEHEIGLPVDEARALAKSINEIVFEPIRQKLEQGLEHPDAQPIQVNGAEAARTQILDAAHAEEGEHVASVTTPAQETPSSPVVQPATPPPAPPQVKVARPSESTAYRPGEPSHARSSVHDDPYREPPV